MKRSIPIWLVAGAAIVIVGLVGYFVGVRPKQSEVKKLDEQISTLEQTLAAAKLSAEDTQQDDLATAIRVADIVKLAKAMPEDLDMPGIILELNSAATAAGVTFSSITPGNPVPGAGYTATPITLTFDGSYYDLAELLFQLRNLVAVRDGVLDSTGRLFTIDSVNLVEPEDGFPQVEAELTVSAYQFGLDTLALALAGVETPTEETTPTDTSATTTEPAATEPSATTTEPASPSEVDVGAQQVEGGQP